MIRLFPHSRTDNRSSAATAGRSLPLPPQLPAKEEAVSIDIPSSSLASDLDEIINQKDHSDVTFKLRAKVFYAHRHVLCTSSNVFRAIFDVGHDLNTRVQYLTTSAMWPKERLAKVSMASVNEGYVKGILSVQTK